jgi:DNA mismatch repair protein MutS
MKEAGQKEDLTPMLAQYHHYKERFKDCLLFFRLGDFYELFYQDAVVGSRELGLVLTSRPAGKGRERIPMCGVPYHSAHNYIQRLVSKGYRIAICEQVEDSSKAKGLVRREVTRVITPGTYFEKETKGFAAAFKKGNYWFVAYLNLATGDFFGARVQGEEVYDLLDKFQAGELLVEKGERVDRERLSALGITLTELEGEFFEEGVHDLREFAPGGIRALGFSEEEFERVLGCALRYARFTQKEFTPFISRPKPYVDEGFVRLDYKCIRGLEILESSEGRKDHSLLAVLDRTLTPMGRRRLRFHLLNPLRSPERIREIQESVETLIKNPSKREKIRKILEGIGDLERLVARISGGMASPREIKQLKVSLKKSSLLKRELEGLGGLLELVAQEIEDLLPLAEEIERVLVDEPPVHLREGGLIKEGVSGELDELRFLRDNAERLLKSYEERLRRETGIQSLKVSHNRVIGYYIEVTKPNLKLVPSYFRRRQTLSGCERFITDELSSLEERILSAQTRINELEYEIFLKLRERILSELERVGRTAKAVGEVDYLQSLAHLAHQKGWVRPLVDHSREIIIEEGRHPVIEEFSETFVPNSTRLTEKERVHIITGPNMAGKSSYIRQVALIVILAHIGSFVPAKSAKIGAVDGIYTRIGSGDVLALGVSTFMNEMLEVSSLLNLATERSLIILDEIGRGTSTYDGIAISKSIVEYIAERLKARTLVATHFHELTELEGQKECVRNYRMEVRREGDRVVFLYRLKEGVAEGSFGIEVAKMAGLPEEIIKGAKEHLSKLHTEKKVLVTDEKERKRKEISEVGKVLSELLNLQLEKTTPLEALIKLSSLREKLINLKIMGFLPIISVLLTFLISGAIPIFSQVPEKELRRDLDYVNRLEKRLLEIDRLLQEKGLDYKLLDELNSYGYPMNVLKNKYMEYSDESYGRLHALFNRVNEVYNLILFVKRGAFPEILMNEVRQIKSPVCEIRTEGKRRETLTIVIENPKDEKAVLDLLTKIQLQYVHLLGVETVNFEKCP